MIQLSATTIELALVNFAIKEQFDAGTLYLFAGPVPANADVALDVVTMHTQVAQIGGGSPGLRLKFSNGALIIDDAYDPWSGTAAFDGFGSAEPTLDVSFFRLCAPTAIAGADNGRGEGGARIQGRVGLVNTAADLKLGVTTYAASDPVTISTFSLRMFGA